MSEAVKKIEVPEEWVSVPLSDCAEILDSKRIPLNSKERSARIEGKSQDQLFPYYGATGQVGFIDDFIFEGEHLLIGEDGAPFYDKSKNVAYLAKGKFWVNNHAHILLALEGVTSNKYLLHYLNKFNYKGFVGGTTRLKLNQANLKQIPVPLPPPEQQKRIVAKIEELFSHIDAGIEALKKAKQLLKQYRQSVLKAAVTGELTKDLPSRQAGWCDALFRNISGKRVPEKSNAYFAYVLECEDGSLYKGYTQDLFARINRHLEGKGAKWTKEHKPVVLIHFEEFESEKDAVEREKYYKSGSGREWINDIRNKQKKKHETAQQLLERILKERRQKWEHEQLRQFTAKGLPAPKEGVWWLYVLLCDDNSFYIGVTEDMPRRWSEHVSGNGAEHTKKHKPISVIHHEEFKSQKEAYNREQELKTGYGRKWLKREFEKGALRQAGKMPKNDKWKEKYKEPFATRDWTFLSEVPDSWSWVSVDQIGDSQDQPVLTGPFGSNLGKSDFAQEGVPVLTIGCLQEEGIDLGRAMHVSKKKAAELERYQLKEGDMLFSRMAAVGRAGFVTPELAGALFNYHIMRLRLHPHAMLQEYFVHYVRGSSQVYDYVKEVNHGATRDGINTQQLLEMPVALAPFQEQKEICKVVGEKLGAIRRLESEIDFQLLKAEKNKQSVLASAFSGLLRTNGGEHV